MRERKRYIFAFFAIFLIVCIPIIVADEYSFTSVTGRDIEETSSGVEVSNGFGLDLGFLGIPASGTIDLPNPQDACTQKSEDIQEFLEFMDGPIGQLAEIFTILYYIGQVLNLIETIIGFLSGVFPGNTSMGQASCRLPAWGMAICGAVSAIQSVFAVIYGLYSPIMMVTMCKSKGSVIFWSWCNSEGASLHSLYGAGEYRLDPFENIYTALSCMCPSAILFNLRKLKLIYQTFNCCVSSNCNNGYSTEGCYQYLDEATCMYWEGSIIDMLWDLIVQLILAKLVEKIIEFVAHKVLKMSQQTLGALLSMARAALALTGLQDAWDNAADMIFSDPDCGDLLDTIGLEYNSAQATTTLITNSNGVYTSTG